MASGGKRGGLRRPLGVCSAGQPSPHCPAHRPVASAPRARGPGWTSSISRPGIRAGRVSSTLVPSLPSLCQTERGWGTGPSWDRGVPPPAWKCSGAWPRPPNFLPSLLPSLPFLPLSRSLSPPSLYPSLCPKRCLKEGAHSQARALLSAKSRAAVAAGTGPARLEGGRDRGSWGQGFLPFPVPPAARGQRQLLRWAPPPGSAYRCRWGLCFHWGGGDEVWASLRGSCPPVPRPSESS